MAWLWHLQRMLCGPHGGGPPRGSCYTHIKVQVEATDGTGWAQETSPGNLTPELTSEMMLTWLQGHRKAIC